ncbi:MAG: cytochrome P450 [Comamonadaceae bacterium]|nr:MAG: cytochrome P450 [Comamonadaceae bacterium]
MHGLMIAKLLLLDKPQVRKDTCRMPPKHAIEAVTHPDPYPYYRSLRTQRPLFFDEALGLWVASGHAAVSAAFAHPQLLVRPPAEPVPAALLDTSAGEVFALLVRMTDGAFHAAHKPAVEEGAKRWTLAEVARASEAATRDLRERCDANGFMAQLPVRTMARLLQVPQPELEDTCRSVQQFVACIAPGAPAQAVSEGAQAAAALMAQGRALGLAAAQAANRIALMQQSLDATAALLGHTALMLRAEPVQAEASHVSLEAMRAFVAEVERYCAPTQNTRRFAGEALTLAGHEIAAGQGVLLVLASANHDAELNPEPDRFDAQRSASRSMGFGEGRHGCPGALIAIEIVASCVRQLCTEGRFDSFFGAQAGFRPLGNIRAPLFAN